MRMSEVPQELRNRKIGQWLFGYLAGGWVLLQVLGFLVDAFEWPKALVRAATVLLACAIPVVLVLAWYHGREGRQRVGRMEAGLLAATMLFAIAASAVVAGRPAGGAPPAAHAASAGERSVAVLPFVSMGGGQDNELFSDGITEEILTALAGVPDLRVPARTSSFYFKGKDLPVGEIARQLGVAHVIMGTVRRAGDQVRITAQLIDARTDAHVWSARYDRELKNVFALQDEIARAVASQLRVSMEATAAGKHVPDPEAYDLYLRGRALWALRGLGNLQQAARYLEAATAKDPRFAEAHAALAQALLLVPFYQPQGGDPAAYLPAQRSARRALALDSTLAEPHAVLGYAAELLDRFPEAEAQFRESLDRDSSDATTYIWYSRSLTSQARFAEAEAAGRRATELDPFSPVAWWSLSNSLAILRRYPEAVHAGQRSVASDTTSGNAAIFLARAYILAGARDSAMALADRATRLEPANPRTVAYGAYVYAVSGRKADAERALSRARAMFAGVDVVAGTYVALGKPDSALALLEPAVSRRGRAVFNYRAHPTEILCAPEFDPLASHPRFLELLKRIGSPACPGRKR